MRTRLDDRDRELLAAPNFVQVSTLRPDGTIHTVPIWGDVDGDTVVLNTAEGRAWPRNLRRDGHTTLTVQNLENPYEYVTITGHVADTAYGPVQIQLIMRNRKIVKVAVLQQPQNTIRDIQIGEFAFPKLISETLTAQDAKVDAVSGASYTSAGYVQSLQSAVDNGG